MKERVLIVGKGSAGNRYAQIFKKMLPDCVIKHVGSREFDHSISDKKMENSWVTFSPTISVVASPANTHIKFARFLSNCSSDLIIEKPLSTNKKGLTELINTFTSNKTVVVVGYNLRFNDSLGQLRELLLAGKIGKPISASLEVGKYLPEWRMGQDYKDTVSANKFLGGGVLNELSHEIDYLVWFFGYPHWVFAKLGKNSNLDINVEDNAKIILTFRPRSHDREILVSVSLDFFRRDSKRRFTVIGETGTLEWDGIKSQIHHYDAEKKIWNEIKLKDNGMDDSYTKLVKSFLNRRRIENKVDSFLDDAVKVVGLLDAARKSTSKGQMVFVKERG